MSGAPLNPNLPTAIGVANPAAGPSFSQLLQILAELVNATNGQATIISKTSITGSALAGDVTGPPGSTVVVSTHLTVPLPVAQGGTGNATGRPAGTAGGDLSGVYPNPQVSETHLSLPLPLAQGGVGATTAPGARATIAAAGFIGPTTIGNVAVFADAVGTVENGGVIPALTTGTWVPALAFGGASTGITYSVQHGSYTQIGRMVFCFFTLTLTSVGSATGAATIGGLPFTSNADVSNAGAGGLCPLYSGMAGLTGVPLVEVAAASASVALLGAGAAVTSALTNANFTGTASLSGSFNYFT
jgi:hypothetical protein